MKKLIFLSTFLTFICVFFISCEKEVNNNPKVQNDLSEEEATLRASKCPYSANQGVNYNVAMVTGQSNTQCCMKVQLIPATAGTVVKINSGSGFTTLVTNSLGQVTYCGPFVYSYYIIIQKPEGNYCGTFLSPCI